MNGLAAIAKPCAFFATLKNACRCALVSLQCRRSVYECGCIVPERSCGVRASSIVARSTIRSADAPHHEPARFQRNRKVRRTANDNRDRERRPRKMRRQLNQPPVGALRVKVIYPEGTADLPKLFVSNLPRNRSLRSLLGAEPTGLERGAEYAGGRAVGLLHFCYDHGV